MESSHNPLILKEARSSLASYFHFETFKAKVLKYRFLSMAESVVNNEWIERVDQLIKTYQIDAAREELSNIVIKKIPADKRHKVAQLARRSGALKLGVKILNDNVFGKSNPDYQDLIEYIGCIRRLGLIHQALNLLDRSPDTSEATLQRAFCHVQLWDYKSSKDLLGTILEAQDLSPLQSRVVKVNYAASLEASGEPDKAKAVLEESREDLEANHPHLFLNSIQLRAKADFQLRNYDQALQTIEMATKFSDSQNFQSSLLLEKWRLLCLVGHGKMDCQSSEISEFKKQARQQQLWELLRDFDWRMALFANNDYLFQYCYFGSPFHAFKKTLALSRPPIKKTLQFLRLGKEKEPSLIYDFLKVQKDVFPYGKDIHRLIMTLASDFYQPWTVHRIFSYLFPEEIFDPQQSPNKIYRLLGRMEKSLKKAGLEDCLETTHQGYRLRPHSNQAFLTNQEMVFADRERFLAYCLKAHSLTENFNVSDARAIIPLSQSQWYRSITTMQEKGLVENLPGSTSVFRLKKVS